MHQARPTLPLTVLVLLVLLVLLVPTVPAGGILEATTLDGERVRLTDYFERGRSTLVMVWTTYCSVCASEFPRIDTLHRAHAAGAMKVLGIAVDGAAAKEEVRAALERRGASFQSLVAEREELAAGYHRYTGEQFTGTPTYLLFNASGELTAHLTGRLDVATVDELLASGAR